MNISEVSSQMSILAYYEEPQLTLASSTSVQHLDEREGTQLCAHMTAEEYERVQGMRKRAENLRSRALQFAISLTVEFPGKDCTDNVHVLIKYVVGRRFHPVVSILVDRCLLLVEKC